MFSFVPGGTSGWGSRRILSSVEVPGQGAAHGRGTRRGSMRIGELARHASLRTSAIRYYEKLGLLAPPHRVGGQRRYPPDTLDRVPLIRFASEMGFSLSSSAAPLSGLARTSASFPDARHELRLRGSANCGKLKVARHGFCLSQARCGRQACVVADGPPEKRLLPVTEKVQSNPKAGR